MIDMKSNRWTREQTIIVFNLYCKIPFQRASSTHPDIVKISKIIGRSPNSVKMKIGNFGSFDPELKKHGIVGLSNASKLDKEVWDEFNNDWEALAFESEKLIGIFLFDDEKSSNSDTHKILPEGSEKESLVKTRVNQNFFRDAVLSAYNSTCCITGIQVPQLLIASHIIPWSKADKKTQRTNPRNGLCLNALHDKAFDRGLFTVTTNYCIKISKKIMDVNNQIISKYFKQLDSKKISLPYRFLPQKEFLEYHNNEIFKG